MRNIYPRPVNLTGKKLIPLINGQKIESAQDIRQGLQKVDYICSGLVAATVYLAYRLGKPVLVEGPVGVGKTELARAVAAYLSLPLIRLQCYEGLDESRALYEWKYGKQLLYTQILKDKLDELTSGSGSLSDSIERLHRYNDIFFSEHFLEPRPLLKALRQEGGCVLLVDEVDKSDQEFEAFLLEILSDYQVSVPELGTVRAVTRPLVFLTSNNSREISDALRRRCLHLFIPLPDPGLEMDIVRARVPGVPEKLRSQLVSFVQQVRQLDIKKVPSVGETIDWARALLFYHADSLSPELVRETLNVILKFHEDTSVVESRLGELLQKVGG